MKTTFATEKVRLGAAIAPVGESANAAPLASMPGVNSDNLATDGLRLILKEALELGKAPGMKPSLGFPTPSLNLATDVGEVFNHDGSSWGNISQNIRRENVVAIPSEASFSPSEASKMPLGGLSTFGLEGTFKAEVSFSYFFHVPVAMKSVIGGHGRPDNTEVYPDSLTIRDKDSIGQLDNDMQVKLSFAGYQVSGSCRITHRIQGIFRNLKRYFHSATCCRHTDNSLIPVDLECVKVITGRAIIRLRVRHFAPFSYQGIRRLQGFGCLSYCLAMQIRNKLREHRLASTVGKAMQIVGIGLALFPTCAADSVKRLSELLNRFFKGTSLLISRKQSDPNGSIHTDIIPYIVKILQIQSKEVSADSSAS